MNHVRRAAALAAACIFILPASAEAAGYADDVLADNPLTYLRLGETTGTVAQDASPNDRDGTYAGDVTLGAAGPFAEAGTAVRLAKTGGVDVAVPAASRTLELWVNAESPPQGRPGRHRGARRPRRRRLGVRRRAEAQARVRVRRRARREQGHAPVRGLESS